MVLLEVGGLGLLILLCNLACFGPPLVAAIVGFSLKKKHPNAARGLFIFAGIYFLIGAGACGSVILG